MVQQERLVFVSYAHGGAGSKCLELCERALEATQTGYKIWSDKQIQSGQNWQQMIESALDQASAAVLFVDWAFVNSDYVRNKEMPEIITKATGMSVSADEGGASMRIPVIAILVESCLYNNVMPWIDTLQIEPEHSMRDTVDPHKEKFGKMLTLTDLNPAQEAQFSTELAKRFMRETATDISYTHKDIIPQPWPPTNSEGGISGYLERGEDLSGNYVDLEITISHSESDSYLVELRYSRKEGQEKSKVNSWCGLVKLNLPVGMPISSTPPPGQAHPGAALLDSVLYGRTDVDAGTTTVSRCFRRARETADALRVPLRMSIGISGNAGELQEIPWETLPLDDGKAAVAAKDILFSRTSLPCGPEAVECQTRARTALRVLWVYSDVGIEATDGADPGRHAAIQNSMREALKELDIDEQGSNLLLRPNQATLLHNLSASASYDVLYLACEAVQRDCEVFLRLIGGDLSRAELMRHFRKAPVPRLVILVPARQLEGSQEDEESTRALLHIVPVFSRLGAASVLTCQRAVAPKTWSDFVRKFFKALNAHGHGPGAMTEARHFLDEDDRWKPMLITRIKAARVWYKPGFVSAEESPAENWESLLDSLARTRLCPVIGPGVHYRLQQARLEIAREMADEYDFPLAFSHRISLPAVIQYARALAPTPGVFLGSLETKIHRRWCAVADINEDGTELEGLAIMAAKRILAKEPNNPYYILARLPIAVYLTTNLDPVLEVALQLVQSSDHERAGEKLEKVTVFNFTKVDVALTDRTGASKMRQSEFNLREPLLVQFYGNYRNLAQAVLAEDDYFEFLASFSERMKDVHGPLEGILSTSDLVFLGFKWNSLEFRVLFRALQKYANATPAESFHIAVQMDPDDDETIHPEKALEYLRRYFSGLRQLQGARISLYWGSTEDFLQELEKRWSQRSLNKRQVA